MPAFNKITLMGNLTKVPELRYTPQGTAVCEFGLAVNKKYDGKDETLFIDVKVFGKTGENCVRYLDKGSLALIDGELSQQRWEDKNSGQQRYKDYVKAFTVQFIGGKPENKEPVRNDYQAPKYEPQDRLVQPEFNKQQETDDIPF